MLHADRAKRYRPAHAALLIVGNSININKRNAIIGKASGDRYIAYLWVAETRMRPIIIANVAAHKVAANVPCAMRHRKYRSAAMA